ncbi:peptidyl-prolyl cis-trans isomerase [Candidatus Entotheonella palauensis]|uniref:PpiC domain-containing protein n=1 Tax=Candidatus Entotheonella gemina TaxID=1429439 RepID=W4MF18_9BACT|nr:peptidylprolyl isomerase [Candidatus Entotheonella palauensis]ETX08247.1 MAG: hypothetical protein ETSY2_06505 [Candidatus Entotheonella gemina]
MKWIFLTVVKSPAVHFAVLGIIVSGLYTSLKPPDREIIHVTTQTIDALVQQRESIVPNLVTPEERQLLTQAHIEDEVLLREAYKRGFDKSNYRVRKQLLNLMRTSLSDVIPEPSSAQLRAFYHEHQARYRTSPSRSFDQVFFAFNSTEQPQDPAQFLKQLQRATGFASLGVYSPLGNTFSKVPFEFTAGTFGKPFARTVSELSLHTWHGPIESFRGIHYVRVTAAHDSELPPFEQIASALRTEYVLQKNRESQQQKIDGLMKHYKIVVE